MCMDSKGIIITVALLKRRQTTNNNKDNITFSYFKKEKEQKSKRSLLVWNTKKNNYTKAFESPSILEKKNLRFYTEYDTEVNT